MIHEKPTATVESLVAEVRALMIGKRQVTMSVYRQLDAVSHQIIEPFGRVRLPDKDYMEPGTSGEWLDMVYVVGRSMKDGSLVRSWVHKPYRGRNELDTGEHRADWRWWDKWNELPLIVLAGLR